MNFSCYTLVLALLLREVVECSNLPEHPPWPELAATPVMGYNGWLAATHGRTGPVSNETLYYNIVDKLISSGLAAAGCVVTDCMWQWWMMVVV